MQAVHINDFKGKHVHFIGIGGISMSSLAEYLSDNGYKVSGSDIMEGYTLGALRQKHINITIGHTKENVIGSDLVVYSAAITTIGDNIELDTARKNNIPTMSRAALLGQIMSSYQKSIGVSGTHGKTTTTGVLSVLIQEAGLDPTVFLGGKMDNIGGNFKVGTSDFCVVEACEFSGSFLEMFPHVAIILNIDNDHLDYFGDMDHVYRCFLDYGQSIKPDGYIIGNCDDVLVRRLMTEVSCHTISFGMNENCDWQATNITFNELGYPSFDIVFDNTVYPSFHLSVPGIHNIYNALSAIVCAYTLGIPLDQIRTGLLAFHGTHRRFELKGKVNDISIIDDYGHHPSEIKATLAAAKNYPHKRLWCVFQPYTFSRTKLLFNEFLSCFDDANRTVITDIMGGREQDTGEIHALELVHALNEKSVNCKYLATFEKATDYLCENLEPGDVVITTGCGNIYLAAEMLVEKLQRKG
jgi:UDP-N-acetylmuramate--alanine ligase